MGSCALTGMFQAFSGSFTLFDLLEGVGGGETDRQRHRETQRDRQTERERQTDRERDRQTGTERQRRRERQTETDS